MFGDVFAGASRVWRSRVHGQRGDRFDPKMPNPRTSPRALLLCAFAAVALVAFVVLGLAGKGAPTGRPAPALPRERLTGGDVTLAAVRGHPVLVTFWASWCEPCEQEAPALERFSRSLHGRATLVGVNWSDTSPSAARSFIRRYGWTFPNLRDPDESAGHDYGVTGLPTTFVLDGSGRVRRTLRGPQTQQSLRQALAALSVHLEGVAQ
jgi:cytochrome c biogenesis protein CcmG, thiol:disulfide interchange protein DsbE